MSTLNELIARAAVAQFAGLLRHGCTSTTITLLAEFDPDLEWMLS
jgi:hypothetical protein